MLKKLWRAKYLSWKKIKQDSIEVVDDGSEPTPLNDLDGGE